MGLVGIKRLKGTLCDAKYDAVFLLGMAILILHVNEATESVSCCLGICR